MRCYLVKFQSCLLGQLHNFEFLQVLIAFFSKSVRPRNMKFFCKKYPYGLMYKINFKFLGRTVSKKNAMLTCKISKLFIRTIVQLWILQDIIAFFSKTVRPRNMKFFLQRVSIWVNIQNKFQVPRSHNTWEKCDAVCKLSSQFSQKLSNRWTWKIFFQRVSICVSIQNKFQVPRSHSIGKKFDVNL